MKKRTRVTHLPDVEVPSDNRALVAPIYQSVKFTFDDVAETERYYQGRRAGFYYSRVSNPTLRQLENALAEMQGRDACLLTGSGMAAISATLIALCKQGDHVVYFAEMYQPTRSLIRRVLGRFGVTSSLLSIDDLAGLERRARGAAGAGDRVRIADQPGAQGRRYRPHHRARPAAWRADAARQHARRASQPRRARHRSLRAQPDQVRFRAWRRDGRRDHRPRRADPGHAIGPDRARPDARPARGLSHAARPADLLRAPRRAVPRRAAHRRVPPCAPGGGTRVVSGPRGRSGP